MNAPTILEAAIRRDRQLVIGALLVVIIGSWAYLLTGAGMGMYPHEMATVLPPTASEGVGREMTGALNEQMPGRGMAQMMMEPVAWTPGYAVVMFFMWWLMMIAMMLPSAAPMILLHATVTRKSAERADNPDREPKPFFATAAFVGGYLLMWAVFSVVAVLGQFALEQLGLLSSMMTTTNHRLGGALLLAAGIWQLTPLKNVCLQHCRSPIAFLTGHWRNGRGGAFRMGVEHGSFCLGCCWFLMVLLFYGGVMNLIWIVALAVFVLLEKLIPAGVWFGRITGVALVVWGGWLITSTF